MDEQRWIELVERWEERDRRWEERDRRWEERDRRWEEERRQQSAFMREMWIRIEKHDIEQRAAHEHLLQRMDAGTEAIFRMLDRFGEGPTPQS